MPTSKDHIPLAGSERAPLPGAQELGPADPSQQIDVTIRMRSRAGKGPIVDAETFMQSIEKRTIMTRSEFEQRHGADPNSIVKVEAFAQEYGLTVKESSVPRRTVILSGTVAAMNEAFGVELKEYKHPTGCYRGRTGPLHLPVELQDVVDGVFGLDNRPQARPHFRRARGQADATAGSSNLSYTPIQVKGFYNFPTGVNGAGQCIALVELGGGYNTNDLSTYWTQLNLSPAPSVSAVSVGNGSNNPTNDPGGFNGEVMLDIEVAGAVAPGASIVVYFAENTDAGFLNAVTTAVHDTTNHPFIVSISWGGPESTWTQQAMIAIDQACQAAAAMGITVCVAAGDEGSTDGLQDGLNHVDFPAASPNVLACGGTRLEVSGNAISGETVWNELANDAGATGGGISDTFPLPAWQSAAGVPPSANPNRNVGRGVPDVSGVADPNTGYVTLVDGQSGVMGGTSAVAPLWAGLIALINQNLGRPAGFINPLLYQNPALAGHFNGIASGNNGAYSASPGWNPCAGLGSPNGSQIAAALGAPPPAQATKTMPISKIASE